MIINGDCLDQLKNLSDDSIDLCVTDPPYGIKFMSRLWDIDVPSVEIWKECLRVLKPGAFCFVMSAPRSDVQNAMISRLMEAGFRLDFTPIYWTYASGFPKAGNIGKLVDKRLGVEREVVGVLKGGGMSNSVGTGVLRDDNWQSVRDTDITVPKSPQAKALDGSYAGYQPKPAVEVIIVAMKPLSEKTYVDQAMKNGKGITWLDDVRVPTDNSDQPLRQRKAGTELGQSSGYNDHKNIDTVYDPNKGRFPANLLVSDDVLNDGTYTKDTGHFPKAIKTSSGFESGNRTQTEQKLTGGGSYSRYFDLDKWASTLPFLIVPKASKREKNEGLDEFEEKDSTRQFMEGADPEYLCSDGSRRTRALPQNRNHHPTVKPIKLMSYLITLGSRKGDTVLDPFVGSGTTAVAAKILGRIPIGIEREAEYAEIARARLDNAEEYIEPEDKQVRLV